MFRWMAYGLMIVAMAFASIANAQEFNPEDFESFIEETMAASNVPGLAVVLFDDNGVRYENAYGRADANGTAVTVDTPFQLGSVSKSFAALLLVQLADEQQIDLDTPVVEILPEFRTRDAQISREITLRHVMSHRSGFTTLDGNRLQDNNYRGDDALDRAVRLLQKAKLNAKPGQRFEYSNANYMVVVALVEKLAGQRFEMAMAERIFEPLGMDNSYVQMPRGDHATAAVGFRQWFGIPKARAFVPGRAMMGAGGVVASARDLSVYVKAISENDERIVPATFTDEIITAQGAGRSSMNGYGFGWMLAEVEGRKAVYHSGLNGGFAAHAAFFPDDGRGGVVLTNQSGALQADVPGAVLRKGLGVPIGPTKPSTGQKVTLWGLVASALSLAFGFIISSRRFAAQTKKVGRVHWVRGIIPAMALFGLAFMLAYMVPRMNGVLLSGMNVFFPDLWLCLVACSSIASIWGVTRLMTHIRANKA